MRREWPLAILRSKPGGMVAGFASFPARACRKTRYGHWPQFHEPTLTGQRVGCTGEAT